MHVVQKYKHLGGIISADGNPVFSCKDKATSATAAYTPVAAKIFGSPSVTLWLKFPFPRTLVNSRNFSNIQTMVMSQQGLFHLNKPYMRALRRIAGNMRYQAEGNISDFEVRMKLNQPSIDCLVMCVRLSYIGRLVSKGPAALKALLQQKVKGKCLAWTSQAKRDLECAYNLCKPSCLPNPIDGDEEALAWVNLNTAKVGDVQAPGTFFLTRPVPVV